MTERKRHQIFPWRVDLKYGEIETRSRPEEVRHKAMPVVQHHCNLVNLVLDYTKGRDESGRSRQSRNPYRYSIQVYVPRTSMPPLPAQ